MYLLLLFKGSFLLMFINQLKTPASEQDSFNIKVQSKIKLKKDTNTSSGQIIERKNKC